MTQTLYAHMNKRNKKKTLPSKKEVRTRIGGIVSSFLVYITI
jgi:hypothetical protein